MNLLDSVSILGDIITGKDTKSQKNKRNESNDNTSIYNSNRLQNGVSRMKAKAKTRQELARDPVRTGIVSKNIRNRGSNRKSILKNKEAFDPSVSDSEFSDNSSVASARSIDSLSNNPNLLINQSNKLLDNRYHERQFQNKNVKDTFLSQYEPMRFDMQADPSSANAVHRSDNGVTRLQTERRLAMQDGYSNFGDDLTFGIVDPNSDNFIHNNMIPQFKSSTYGSDVLNNQNRNSVSQRKMEAFTGNMPDIKIVKTEQKPLFSPLIGITNIYGTPSITGMIEDRYTPGRERKNELPFRQERITTGLNLGYNEVNKNGDNFRALPKTIDELRTLDNQQKTYTMGVVEGQKGARGPVIGETKKYRPERTKYWGDDRLLPSLGYIRAPAIYGEVNPSNLATVNRGVGERVLLGPAQSEIQQATPDTVREKYKVDFKQNFSQAEPRNVILVEGLQAREDSKKYIHDPTQRSQNLDYVGPIGNSETSKGVAFDMVNNIFDITKRNVHEKTDRYGAGGNSDYLKPVFYDPRDVTKTTMRNVHDKYDRHGVQFKDEFNKSYAVDRSDVQDPTLRDIHDKTDRYGAGGNSERGGNYTIDFKTYTPDVTLRDVHDKTDRYGAATNSERGGNYTIDFKTYTPDTTMRDIHDKFDRYGREFKDSNDKSYVIDYKNATPDMTMRAIHEKTDRAGAASTGDQNKSYTIDFKTMTPDMTMRAIHEKTDRAGAIMTGDQSKGYTIDFKTMTPDMTMRAIHEKTDRAGNMGTTDQNKSYALDYVNSTPDMTMREIHSKLDRSAAGANGVYHAGRTRDDAANSQINITREVIAKGRAPTNSKFNMGPIMDFTTVSLCEPIQINRDLLSSTIAINDKLPFTVTQTPTGRSVRNTRINEYTEKNLNNNPFINNLVHKSVEIK